MTNGVLAIRKKGELIYKCVVGCDGSKIRFVVQAIHERYGPRGAQPAIGFPTADELYEMCISHGFGCRDCLVILELNPERWNEPFIHGKHSELDEDAEGKARYLDTFHVAQFNPRWKYGIAPYVEVIDL